MFSFNNTHIFTGYLKQLLSSVNIPMCKIYTKEFEEFFEKHGFEDPRIIESIEEEGIRINYLKNNGVCNFFGDKAGWKLASNIFYSKDRNIQKLTKTLNSYGVSYDANTHEYLGDYLRFIRDYHNINLMPLYNCFSNKIYNNIFQKYEKATLEIDNPKFNSNLPESSENKKTILKSEYTIFDSQDPNHTIYAFPVKLFENYTIAVDCHQGIELFCGAYRTTLDILEISSDPKASLLAKTYRKVNKTMFNQPFLYDCLDVSKWKNDDGSFVDEISKQICYKMINREKDLKLFIKIPNTCKSSISILEGDYTKHNQIKFSPVSSTSSIPQESRQISKKQDICITVPPRVDGEWVYQQNHSTINFEKIDENFVPITKLQLLSLNTGESYPFSPRLVEYLIGSAITPIDEMTDNIKRVQRTMNLNNQYFKIEGLWEDKMQPAIYDHLNNAGPFEVIYVCIDPNDVNFGKEVAANYYNNSADKANKLKKVLIDRRRGYQRALGHTSKSTLYDVLGYVDKDAEKWYTSWRAGESKAELVDSIHSVDIYDGLYDI